MQVVNGSTPFQTPQSGVGSVIFDYPNQQPLDMLLKANEDLDKFAIRRQAVKAANQKTTNDLLAGLTLKPDGAMLQHVPYFKEKGNKIFEAAAKTLAKYNGDLSTPEAQRAWLENVQMPSQQFEVEVKGSQNLGNVLEKVRTELNTKPDDWEQDASHTNIALLRTTPPDQLFKDAQNVNPDNLLVRRNKSYQSLVANRLKELPRKPASVPNEKGELFSVQTTGTGKDVMIQQTETLPINDAVELLRGFDADKDMMDAANADWSKVKGTPAEDYYLKLAADYQSQGLPINDAFQAFRLKNIELNNQKDKQLTSLGENMYAKKALGDKDELDSARGLYDNVVKMFAGDPQFIKPDYYNSKRTKVDGTNEEKKIFGTGVSGLEGRQLGQFIISEDGKTAPNIIVKAFRNPDGQIGVITAESQALYEAGATPDPVRFFKTPYNLITALVNGAPSEGKDITKTDKLLGNINKVEAEYRNKYGNNWEAQAGLTPEQIAKRDEIRKTQWTPTVNNKPVAQPVVQPKTTAPKTQAKKQYTKAELTAKAKAAGYTYNEYYDLVKDKVEVK